MASTSESMIISPNHSAMGALARIKALLRRTHTETTTSDKTAYIQNHELRIDLKITRCIGMAGGSN
ncbi:MAG: response regulator transcription factor [Saprospiraceae bacterium]|nr:response regulator transcription factor [Saprospiraceae bacterium]